MKPTRTTPAPAPSGPGSGDPETAAAQWVVARRAGLDEAGERAFAAWCAESPAHTEAYARMEQMSAVFQRARAQGAGEVLRVQLAARSRRRRARRQVVFGVAAVLALGWGAWLGLGPVQPGEKAPMVAQAFNPLRRLADGSIVELNRGAEISVVYDATSRRVELVRGEALFRVEKDPGRPFIVRAGGVEVRAVGTAFNVRLDPAKVEVLVTEGKVGIDDTARGASLLPAVPAGETPLLVAGQRVVVAAGLTSAPQAAQPETIAPEEIKRQLAWRIPLLEFDGVELAAAVGQMNRENRIQIVIRDEATRRLRISGTFVSDDPQTFTRMVAATFGLEVKHPNATELILEGK